MVREESVRKHGLFSINEIPSYFFYSNISQRADQFMKSFTVRKKLDKPHIPGLFLFCMVYEIDVLKKTI